MIISSEGEQVTGIPVEQITAELLMRSASLCILDGHGNELRFVKSIDTVSMVAQMYLLNTNSEFVVTGSDFTPVIATVDLTGCTLWCRVNDVLTEVDSNLDTRFVISNI